VDLKNVGQVGADSKICKSTQILSYACCSYAGRIKADVKVGALHEYQHIGLQGRSGLCKKKVTFRLSVHK